MITSKFIWDAFEKFQENVFYIDKTKNSIYKEVYDEIIKTAALIRRQYKNNELVAVETENSLQFIIQLFSLFYLGSVPVLNSSKVPKELLHIRLDSIECLKYMRVDKDRKVLDDDFEYVENENASVIYTSGTTSIAKAVLHSYKNHYYSALGSNQNIHIQQNDRWLLSLPMHHIGGLSILFRTIIAGASVVMYDKELSLADTIEKYKITHLSVVDAQLQQLIEEPNKLSSLKAILVGGGTVRESNITKAIELKLPIFTTYGLSEMTSQVTTTSSNADAIELQTSGKPLAYRQIKIEKDYEILVKGEVLCENYLNAQMKVDSEGWFHTGDIGSFDENNNLTITGRVDNMFVSGGENVYPEPIEKIICSMHNIEEACIVPVEDKKFGKTAFLFYKTTDNSEISAAELYDFLKDKVQKFEIPKKLSKFPKEYKPLGIKLYRQFFKEYVKSQNY